MLFATALHRSIVNSIWCDKFCRVDPQLQEVNVSDYITTKHRDSWPLNVVAVDARLIFARFRLQAQCRHAGLIVGCEGRSRLA